jgi:hypothetical protein
MGFALLREPFLLKDSAQVGDVAWLLGRTMGGGAGSFAALRNEKAEGRWKGSLRKSDRARAPSPRWELRSRSWPASVPRAGPERHPSGVALR